MDATTPLFIFLLGLCVGSFLNVVVLRTHDGRSLNGRSCCGACKKPLGPLELIPVVSYLALRGKCRGCGAGISIQYPLVEFATGVLFLAVYLHYVLASTSGELGPVEAMRYAARDLALLPFLILIFIYDLKYFLILDRFTVPAMVLALGVNLWLGVSVAGMALAAGVLGGFFLLQYVVSKGKWIGGGDIRMGILMGLMLGWPLGLLALFFSYAAGAMVGIAVILTQRGNWRTQIPFGTFLAVGTIIALLWGEQVIAWYLGMLGF